MANFDVFLSHNSVDKKWVIKLKEDLERYGVSVWLDKDEIRPGDLFAKALEQGLSEAGSVALIISPESVASGWVEEEYYRALSLTKKPEAPLQLIPVILRTAEIPSFIESRTHVNFKDETLYAEKVWYLVWGITGQKPPEVIDLSGPASASPAPSPPPPPPADPPSPPPETLNTLMNAVFSLQAGEAEGTCFLIDSGQYLLTAREVVVDQDSRLRTDITVEIGKETYGAAVEKIFDEQAVALLKLHKDAVALLRLDKDTALSPLKYSTQKPTASAEFLTLGSSIWDDSGTVVESSERAEGKYDIEFGKKHTDLLFRCMGAPLLNEENLVVGLIIAPAAAETGRAKIVDMKSLHIPLDFALKSMGAMSCYVILSEAEKAEKSKLKTAVEEAEYLFEKRQQYEPDIVAIRPTFSSATEIVSDPSEYEKAIYWLCRSDIAIFDVTDFEPAVMLLLGIRSVVRRGITIASTGKSYASEQMREAPFNIKEVNLISHSSENPADIKDACYLIEERIMKGLNLSNSLQYLDLPAFDAVRNLPQGERKTIPRSERILVLCSYSADYEKNHWKNLKEGLEFALKPDTPSISRVLDLNLGSPRLVSQMIYEVIRRIKMCVVDWTEWRPNVFFEFGIRLAVAPRKSGTVCIIEGDHKNAINDKPIAQQCQNLLSLFSPIEYSSGQMKPKYGAILERDKQEMDFEGDSEVISGAYHRERIAQAIDWRMETVLVPVHRQLLEEIELLISDDTEGVSSVLYPENNDLRKAVEHSLVDRLMVAWFYLENKYKPEEIQADLQLKSDFERIGRRLALKIKDTNPTLSNRIRERLAALTD